MLTPTSSRADCFRLLDLPAELRNRMYYISATTNNHREGRLCALPELFLAHTCRQVRTEYFSICMTAPVAIKWNTLPAYCRTFYSTTGSLKYAPSQLTLVIDGSSFTDRTIDILPLVMMQHSSPQHAFQLACSADADEGVDGAEWVMENSLCFYGDRAMFEALLRHRHAAWVYEVKAGNVVSVKVCPLSTGVQPLVVFGVADEKLIACGSSEATKEYYFGKVQMGHLWSVALGGVVLCMDGEVRYVQAESMG